MNSMFWHCFKLTTIYVSPYNPETQKGWTNISIDTSDDMFKYDGKLVGGNGTTYNSDYTDKTYARIDEEGKPGYFTNIADKEKTE
jgi:hypothetical protein